MEVLSHASQAYMNTFSAYTHTFMHWGQCLFFSLLVINITWMALWYAFDKQSISESMSSFIKKFAVIAIFYTIMTHPNWMLSVLDSVNVMGKELTHHDTDPSSVINMGLGLANKILTPFNKTSFLTAGFGLFFGFFAYIIVLAAFITIAMDLAVTLIVTTALISLSTFFLGFAALNATSQIARQTLDVILANCIKILGIYIVVAAGTGTINSVVAEIPDNIKSFDPFVWIVAVAILFGMLAKTLPNQLAKIVSGAIQENPSAGGAAAALSAIQLASTVLSKLNTVANVLAAAAKIAGSTAFNAAAHFQSARSGSAGIAGGLGAGVVGSASDLIKSAGSSVSDRFKNLSNKMAGGPGSQQPIRSVSERMYQHAKDKIPEKSEQ